MQLNPSAKVRLAIYITFGVGAFVVDYLFSKGVISIDEVTLFVKSSAFIFGLAGINVNKQ